MVCSLHSVTTGSRDRANVPLTIIIRGIFLWSTHAFRSFTTYTQKKSVQALERNFDVEPTVEFEVLY